MKEQAGQDDLGLWVGTVLKNEMRQVDRAGLSGRPGVWFHAECMGVPWRVISRVWQDPSGCCVANGLLGGRGDERDEGGCCCSHPGALDQGRGKGVGWRGERKTGIHHVHYSPPAGL